jgi:hypothetical protein
MGQKNFKDKSAQPDGTAAAPTDPAPESDKEVKKTDSQSIEAQSQSVSLDAKQRVEGVADDDKQEETTIEEEEIDMSEYTAPAPSHIPPAHTSIFNNNESCIDIKLMPHQHTLFCERKVFYVYHASNRLIIRYLGTCVRCCWENTRNGSLEGI